MARKNLVRSDVFPYHVTSRTNNKELFPIPLNEVWKLVESECMALWMLYGAEFQNVVLMPNHIHMILTVPNEDLGILMNQFFKNLAQSINYRAGKTGHVFGGPYHWSIITSTRYFGHAFKYVYRNPVRAGLCQNVEDYEFSTIQGLFGNKHLPFPAYHTRCGAELNIPDLDRHFDYLEWLNRPFTKEAEALIRFCLRKKRIDTLLNRALRKPEPLLEGLL